MHCFPFRNSPIYEWSLFGEKCRFLLTQKPTVCVYEPTCVIVGLDPTIFPHFAENFFLKHKTAFCGNLFFVWASFRILRKAVFRLGELPHFAESRFSSGRASAFCGKPFFVWASFRILRKAVFLLGEFPHFAESRFSSGQETAWCGFSFFSQAQNRNMRKAISVQYTHDAFLFDSGSLYIVFAYAILVYL